MFTEESDCLTAHLDVGAVPVRDNQHVCVSPGGGAVSHRGLVEHGIMDTETKLTTWMILSWELRVGE